MRSIESRKNKLFLRNNFIGTGKYDIPVIYKQKPDLTGLRFLGFHNTRKQDKKIKIAPCIFLRTILLLKEFIITP
jgi:hypothetical protein